MSPASCTSSTAILACEIFCSSQDNLSYLLYSSFPPKIFEGEGTWRSGEDQNDGYTMLSVAPPWKKSGFDPKLSGYRVPR